MSIRHGRTVRGTSNGNVRGNSQERRKRRSWLLTTFGDGETAPCAFCGIQLTNETLTVDRITPGCDGGRYTRDNIRPACFRCNSTLGGGLHHR